MNNYCIKPATAEHVSDIHRLTLEGILIWGSDITENIKPWVDTLTEASFLEKIQSDDYEFFVAEDDAGKVIGTINMNTATRHMSGLYCDVRGMGLGTALLNRTFEVASDYGFEDFECEIREENIPSISLMTKYGAEKTGANPIAGVNYVIYTFPQSAFRSVVAA